MIGTGYVGLVTGTCFAEFGHHVTCVDKLTDKIDQLNAGHIPIYEPGLDALVAKNREEKRLHFTTDVTSAVAGADAVFLAVGTPTSRRGDGYADLTMSMRPQKNLPLTCRGIQLLWIKAPCPWGPPGRYLGL